MKKEDLTAMSLRQGIASSTISPGGQKLSAIHKLYRQKTAGTTEVAGYQDGVLTGSLNDHPTHTIGVIVHDLNNQFISSVLKGIGSVASDAGYNVVMAYSAENTAKEVANARNFFKRQVNGVIASLVSDSTDLSHFRPFHDANIPVIFFDRAEKRTDSTMVVIDNVVCGYKATTHLLQQGCRRIALVIGNPERDVYAQRYVGYARALREHGIEVDENLVLINSLTETSGTEVADALMRMPQRPDGAFITNDFTAAVCMRKLSEAGWRIPQDLAIVGFNDDLISRIVTPQLTTIQYPGEEIGEIAARSMISHLNGDSNINEATRIVVRSQLIQRASSQRLGTVS